MKTSLLGFIGLAIIFTSFAAAATGALVILIGAITSTWWVCQLGLGLCAGGVLVFIATSVILCWVASIQSKHEEAEKFDEFTN